MSTQPQIDFTLTNSHYKILTLCTLMATIAFFDFIAFWYSTNTLAYLFFPKDSDVNRHFWYMVVIFGLGYLSRPFGAIFIGRYGDKHGRKPAMMLSFISVTFFTLMIALLPTYSEIGILATILFVLSHLGQGIAFGSQLPTLWVYATEHLPINSIGMACGIITSGSVLSVIILISLLGFLDTTLTQSELLSYGWRLPFLISGLMGILLLFLTKNLKETPVFLNKTPTQNFSAKQRWQGFVPVLILSWFVSSIVIVLVFLLTELIKPAFLIDGYLLIVSFILSLLFLVVGCVFFGFLTDRTNAGKVLTVGCVFLLLSIVVLFYDLSKKGTFMLLTFSLTGFFAGIIGAVPAIMVRLCPAHHRLRTLSVGYNISYAVIGAFIPILLGFFTYHADFTPALYLSFVCIVTMFLGFYIYYSPRNKEDIEN